MTTRSIRSYAVGIGKGYQVLLKSAGIIIGGILTIMGLSIVIVTPLWLLATRYTTAYSILILGGLLSAGLGITIYRICTQAERRKRFFIGLAKSALFIAGVGLLYLIVILFSWRIYAAAVPLSAVFFVLTGLFLYGKKPSES